jgi:hypothetical protein
MSLQDPEQLKRMLNEAFAQRETARRDLIRASMRDPRVWAEQAMVLILGLVRAVVVWLALRAILSIWPLYEGWPVGEVEGVLSVLALALMPVVVLFNPRRMFFRNVFAARVDATLEEYFDK